MIVKYLLSDRSIVGILMLLYNKGSITTTQLADINRNYEGVKKIALQLRDAGLITSESDPGRKVRVLWKLTD